MVDQTPGALSGQPSDLGESDVLLVESGLFEAHADSDHAWVRRDATGEVVQVNMAGFPPGFIIEPGVETGIELVDDVWHALPSVVYSVRLNTRIEWWTMNRLTGEILLLAEHHFRRGRTP